MTYEVVWDETTVATAAKYLDDDPAGLAALLEVIDRLGQEPRPAEATPLGSANLRRLHCGRYRVLLEVDDATRVVTLIHVGRLG